MHSGFYGGFALANDNPMRTPFAKTTKCIFDRVSNETMVPLTQSFTEMGMLWVYACPCLLQLAVPWGAWLALLGANRRPLAP